MQRYRILFVMNKYANYSVVEEGKGIRSGSFKAKGIYWSNYCR